jgi:hypothetical protein
LKLAVAGFEKVTLWTILMPAMGVLSSVGPWRVKPSVFPTGPGIAGAFSLAAWCCPNSGLSVLI